MLLGPQKYSLYRLVSFRMLDVFNIVFISLL